MNPLRTRMASVTQMDAATPLEPRISLDLERIAALCRTWHIVEFALFGSVLTDEFRPDSDVDVLLEFAQEAKSGADEVLAIHAELEAMFGRDVDIAERKYLKNPFRRHHILTHKRVIYAA